MHIMYHPSVYLSLKVCNHPDLFECRDVMSPLTNLSVSLQTVPCLLYDELIHPSVTLNKYLIIIIIIP